LWASAGLVLAGCGQSYTLVPASGTLKIDGKPAGNIMVQFMPDASKGCEGPTSSGISDASGRFELTTLDNRPGAVVGEHVVLLIDQDEDRPEQGEESQRPSRLSSSYATERGGLRVKVAEGEEIVLNAVSVENMDEQGDLMARPAEDEPMIPDRSRERDQ
jgi:hypothetical protein